MTRFDQVVVGGGVIGLATAWQLAQAGQRVVLLERFAPGHTHGASHGATRNMNNAYEEGFYLDLYDEALGLWQGLEERTGERLLTLSGLVTHGDPEVVRRAHDALIARGAATSLITPDEAAERWPGMRFEGEVLVNRDAGRIHSATALEVFTAEATRLGADIRFGHRVTGLEVLGADRVAVTVLDPSDTEIRLEASGVVVAAGAWSKQLLSGLVDLPRLTVTEEHPAHFTPHRAYAEPGTEGWWPSFNHVLLSAEVESRRGNVYGMLTPGEGVKVGFHATGDEVDPDDRRFRASDIAREALRDYVAEWFPGLDPTTASEISCTYTSTESGRFVLDRVGPITVGAGFSGHGFKFAPAIGRVLADAALGAAFPPEQFRLAAH